MTPATQDLIRRTIVTSKTSEGLERAIELALREQDKRTRHACAEAVNALRPDGGTAYAACLNLVSRAHAACLNTQSI